MEESGEVPGEIKRSQLSRAEKIAKLREMHEQNIAKQRAMESSAQNPTRLMLDPSFLFSADAVSWLREDQGARDGIVIPAAFEDWLYGDARNADISFFVAPDDRDEYWARLGDLRDLLSGVAAFGQENVQLSDPDEAVRSALLELGGTPGRILADEWTFLESNSWAVSKLRRPLDAFSDAGSVIVQFGRKSRDNLMTLVVKKEDVPEVLTKKFLAQVSVKWLLLGGAAVGVALVPVAAPAGLLASPVLQAIDP